MIKISTISDFYDPGTSQLYSKEQFENQYEVEIDVNYFTELKSIIKSAFTKLGIVNEPNICSFFPKQPLLIATLNIKDRL